MPERGAPAKGAGPAGLSIAILAPRGKNARETRSLLHQDHEAAVATLDFEGENATGPAAGPAQVVFGMNGLAVRGEDNVAGAQTAERCRTAAIDRLDQDGVWFGGNLRRAFKLAESCARQGRAERKL